uniref:procollagen-proline 4-dioxygenase n=1 Tax=Araucaria cunninghamii TaxID=56994 RepID=A0A0D6R4C7_ARACU
MRKTMLPLKLIWFRSVKALALALALALHGQFAESAMEFPGWLGETYRMPLRTKKDASKFNILNVGQPSGFDPTRVTQLSWNPRAFLYKNFLTDEECDHLIELARGKLEKSMVADNDSGKSVMSEIRTSSGMFLSKGQDEIVARIEDRIAAWSFLPKENGEAMQILHYEHGQKYEPHFDFFHDKVNQAMGGHRIATVLMYLSDVVKGGETVFPNAESRNSQPKDDSWSECAKQGYSVKPNKGDALLFFSLHPDATTDETSLHGSCPVIEGEKWSATKWIHVRAFEFPKRKTGECVDENELCAHWAALGECKKNPIYMVGTADVPGACRKSCQVC